MSSRILKLSDSRSVAISSLEELEVPLVASPFVVLVPAYDEDERRNVLEMSGSLIGLGCVEFCCVGREAEQLHDALDDAIEQRGVLEVLTTWHTDSVDACEYFLFAAGGATPALLALISSHIELVTALVDTISRE